MTTAKRIANSRKHLAIGNEESYKALMAADLRAAMSTRATNAIKRALKEDGYSVSDKECPIASDIILEVAK
tara:strand:+ start:80 stop:292 length:213 start_codon:yes stop_codon:yes gene_type:complete